MLDVVISGFTAVQTAAELAHDYDMTERGISLDEYAKARKELKVALDK